MKKVITILLAGILALGLAACGGPSGPDDMEHHTLPVTQDPNHVEESEPAPATTAEDISAEADTLVVYFSATGTTKDIAEKIASVTGADLYEIKAAQEYSEEDLNWSDSNSRSTKEQNDPDVRPEIASEPVTLDGYKTVYIGFPIWWGEEPRIMDTFVESYNFDGITMIPFCTSSSSGIGNSGSNLESHAGSGTWLEGQRFLAGTSESLIETWIAGLEYSN